MRWVIKMESGKTVTITLTQADVEVHPPSGKTDPLLALLHVLKQKIGERCETQTSES